MKRIKRLLPLLCLSVALAVNAEDAGTRVHMQEHLVCINAINEALLDGDLDGLREPAIWLADHEPLADVDLLYEPFLLALRKHARAIATATDVPTAAEAAARIAVDCGNCHRATHVVPDFGHSPTPPEWDDMASHMQRHRWAVDRLWEGLTGPSDVGWRRGSRMLAEAPLLGTDPGWDETQASSDAWARRVHELGRDAASALTPEARIVVYRKIISACAGCHAQAARGPRPD